MALHVFIASSCDVFHLRRQNWLRHFPYTLRLLVVTVRCTWVGNTFGQQMEWTKNSDDHIYMLLFVRSQSCDATVDRKVFVSTTIPSAHFVPHVFGR